MKRDPDATEIAATRKKRREQALQIVEKAIDGFSVVGSIRAVVSLAREYAAKEYKEEVERLKSTNDKLIEVNSFLVAELNKAHDRIRASEASVRKREVAKVKVHRE